VLEAQLESRLSGSFLVAENEDLRRRLKAQPAPQSVALNHSDMAGERLRYAEESKQERSPGAAVNGCRHDTLAASEAGGLLLKSAIRAAFRSLGYEVRRLPVASRRTATATTTTSAEWNAPFEVLRGKWGEVPTTRSGRRSTRELLSLSDADLLAEWERCRADITTGDEFSHRGWYHLLYAPLLAGKNVADIGSGFGIDSITFAQHGARMTFVDLVPENLEVLRRLCAMLHIEDARFLLLEDLGSLDRLHPELDVIMAMGSLHHAPQQTIAPEVAKLRSHLKPQGRWLQLAYPRSRWERDGCPPFDRWGEVTDGVGTPWGEWYDVEKLLALHQPGRFDVVLTHDFHRGAFNWFDLRYLGER
jgi:2-polyprenyl-3-methyl-5-hydroxy-6-metoxy-1,4-benzoquinol methylase